MFFFLVYSKKLPAFKAFSTNITKESPAFVHHLFVVFIMVFVGESFATVLTEELVLSLVVNLDVSL